MSPLSINERVTYIKDNEIEINGFVEEYKPFIATCVQKATGRYVRYGTDDELSIGLMAFVEAIKAYDLNKGNFLSFSQNIIKRRLIDYYRKEKKTAM
jgi:RNA polymerase sigma factor